MSPEKECLEDYIPFEIAPFLWDMLVLWGVNTLQETMKHIPRNGKAGKSSTEKCSWWDGI